MAWKGGIEVGGNKERDGDQEDDVVVSQSIGFPVPALIAGHKGQKTL